MRASARACICKCVRVCIRVCVNRVYACTKPNIDQIWYSNLRDDKRSPISSTSHHLQIVGAMNLSVRVCVFVCSNVCVCVRARVCAAFVNTYV